MNTNSRQRSADSLRASAGITQLAGLVAVVSLAWTARAGLHLSELYPLKAGALFAIVVAFTMVLLHDNHPFARYGPANQITTVRAVLVALVASLIGEPRLPAVATWAAGLGVIVGMLDGVDGWLARRSRMASDFGARFDMETDAAAGDGAGDPCVEVRQSRRLGRDVGTAAVSFPRGRLVVAMAAAPAPASPSPAGDLRRPDPCADSRDGSGGDASPQHRSFRRGAGSAVLLVPDRRSVALETRRGG